MIIRQRYLRERGYKGSSIWADSAYSSFYYKSFPEKRAVVGIGNIARHNIFVFRLTPVQYREFQRGRLSLIPPDCCNATGKPSLDNYQILHQGEFTSHRELHARLDELEPTIEPLYVRPRNQRNGRRSSRAVRPERTRY